MMRKRIFFLFLLFSLVIAHPADTPDGSGSSDPEFDLQFNDDLSKDEIEDRAQREEALTKLQQIFGLPQTNDGPSSHKIPPQFMVELYNTIADPNGITRGKNPYNAKIVRSFIERDSSMSHYYFFNISGLDVNESVLEAELHLYRKRTPFKSMHPAVLSSPYYLIRVYQVLDEHQLDIPDLHRLLNVHYVGAHASGWQVFNVKQAVLSWLSGARNLGLLVTASNLFGDDAAVHFSRRGDYRHSKQPILVLFDDDGEDGPAGENVVPRYYESANDIEDDGTEDTGTYNGGEVEPEDNASFEKDELEKRKRLVSDPEKEPVYEGVRGRDRRGASSSRSDRRIVSKNPKLGEALTSLDIYERAMMRRRLSKNRNSGKDNSPDPESKRRLPRSTPETSTPKSNTTRQSNETECSRHDLYVDFEEMGWSKYMIEPKGYSAYHCRGHCNFPLSQGQHPTNHATIQSLVHILRQGKDVNQPCCVPTKLLSISLLYYLDDSSVVLKRYQDMVADRCGCH